MASQCDQSSHPSLICSKWPHTPLASIQLLADTSTSPQLRSSRALPPLLIIFCSNEAQPSFRLETPLRLLRPPHGHPEFGAYTF